MKKIAFLLFLSLTTAWCWFVVSRYNESNDETKPLSVHLRTGEVLGNRLGWAKITGDPVLVFSPDSNGTNINYTENSIDLMQIEVSLNNIPSTAFVNLHCLSVAQGGYNSFAHWRVGDEVLIISIPSKCGDGRGGVFNTSTYFITNYRRPDTNRVSR